jgi:hypothetical protein
METMMHRKADPYALGAFVVSMTVALVVVVVAFNVIGQVRKLDTAVLGSCERVQNERERTNVVEAVFYSVLLSASRNAASRVVRRDYGKLVGAAAWSPPADCEKAGDDPGNYIPPPAVPFSELPDDFPQRVIAASREGRPQPLP